MHKTTVEEAGQAADHDPDCADPDLDEPPPTKKERSDHFQLFVPCHNYSGRPPIIVRPFLFLLEEVHQGLDQQNQDHDQLLAAGCSG